MNAKELLDLYSKVTDLPPMQLYALSVTPERIDSADKVYEQLVYFQPAQGWAGFQSANRFLPMGKYRRWTGKPAYCSPQRR